jgi:hypothetical protein
MVTTVDTSLRPTLSTRAREARLGALLQGRRPEDLGLPEQVLAAQALGSLELAGSSWPFEEVLAAARGGEGPPEVLRLVAALRALDPQAPASLEAIRQWHGGLFPGEAFRTGESLREPPGAPPRFIETRLRDLAQWLDAPAAGEIQPSRLGAVAMARFLEIHPFPDGNGRVARILASHVVVRAGGRPPILVKADGPLLRAALLAAFRLETEPLAFLLEEASGRSLDVMIQCLARPTGP